MLRPSDIQAQWPFAWACARQEPPDPGYVCRLRFRRGIPDAFGYLHSYSDGSHAWTVLDPSRESGIRIAPIKGASAPRLWQPCMVPRER